MLVTQVKDLVNLATKEALGAEAIQTEDLTNVVDMGEAIFNANAVDAYVRSLVNHIGKVIFVNRPYAGSAPSVLMDGWEFGSVLEKITAELPEASENETWDLQDKQSYDPNIFYKPTVEAKFYNKRVTFEIDVSITERQVKQSFSSATQLNAFVSMIYNEVDKAMTIKIDSLVMKTIVNMISVTLTDNNANRAVNLLALYNSEIAPATPLTAAKALYNLDFIKFASYKMKLYATRLGTISRLFNIGGKARFTPRDLLHIVMLEEFKSSADVYLQSDTFHNEFVKLPEAEGVAYWQGSGTDYAFDSTSKIMVKDAKGNSTTKTGILAVMFDRDALGVCNKDKRVTTDYNAKAEFYNNFYKFDCEYFNDTNENFVVFYIADK